MDDIDLKIEKIRFYQNALFKIYEFSTTVTNSQRLDWCQKQIEYIFSKIDEI